MVKKEYCVSSSVGLLIALMGLFVAGCGSGSGTLGEAPTELNRNRALWRSRSIDSYAYTFRYGGFVPKSLAGPVRVEVRNGTVVSVTPTEPGAEIDRAFFARFDTIDELFDVIRQEESGTPDRLDTTYDPATGVPTQFYVDREFRMADEEYSFDVTGFTAL
ncbi:MAG: DUF6174 domain-containing protein [Capsulimonadales bacterium]|nr:DUF6174 domain-containing protein [Capsulimonadales bacterium]